MTDIPIDCSIAEIAGELTCPPTGENRPCVILVGGTLSHDRDGRCGSPGAPPRDALKRLAEALGLGGYATLRYDRPGFGNSIPKDGWVDTYSNQARVLAALIRFVRERDGLGPVVAVGESAGAYVLCLAARDGTEADAAIFLGGFCGSSEELYEYNFGRLVEYAESSPDRMKWAEQNAFFEMVLGRNYRDILDAASRGDDYYHYRDGRLQFHMDVRRRHEELSMPPDRMFRYVTVPALAVAGEYDLNVPPGHLSCIESVLCCAGNPDVTTALIPGADHSFQAVADDKDTRIRERYTFESFRRVYQPEVYRVVLRWLLERFPTGVSLNDRGLEAISSRPTADS